MMYNMLPLMMVFSPLISALGVLLMPLTKLQVKRLSLIGMFMALVGALATGLCLSQGWISLPLIGPSWIPVLNCFWGISLTSTELPMILMVTSVSFAIHVYSTFYMDSDPGFARFMAYINLFTFFMIVLCVSPNILQLFVGWEGMGVMSYLLINFWHQKPRPPQAARQAFIVNRVADVGLLWGLIGTIILTQTVNFAAMSLTTSHLWPWVGLGLLIGAMGKSAQFGFHIWLPAAMEGPTPVSALIHAATMVTAGAFLFLKMPWLLDIPSMKIWLQDVGMITCVFASLMALNQKSLKGLVAYSTCSQLGLLFLGLGFAAFSGVLEHILAHACFKSLIFLCVANITLQTQEKELRALGKGLATSMPWTYSLMITGIGGLIALPPFWGFNSKNMLTHSWPETWVWILSALTSFYGIRLFYETFHQSPNTKITTTDIPFKGRIPLMALALSLVTGFALAPWPSEVLLWCKPLILAIVAWLLCTMRVFEYLSPSLRALDDGMAFVYDSGVKKPVWFLASWLSERGDTLWHQCLTLGVQTLGRCGGQTLQRFQTLSLSAHWGIIFVIVTVFLIQMGRWCYSYA